MKISFIVLLHICLFCSCKKEKPSTPKTYDFSLSAEGLSYVQIPLNRYFIYKDSATGTLDSVVVTQSTLEKQYQPASTISGGLFVTSLPAYYYQTFSLLLTRYGTTHGDWFYGETSDRPLFGFGSPLFDTLGLQLEERNRAASADLGLAFSFNIGTVGTDSIILTLTVEGKIYTNVLFCSDWNGLDSSNAAYRRSYYYWVKNLGIIKREIKTFGSTKTEFLIRNG
jgi:hypothetical protein